MTGIRDMHPRTKTMYAICRAIAPFVMSAWHGIMETFGVFLQIIFKTVMHIIHIYKGNIRTIIWPHGVSIYGGYDVSFSNRKSGFYRSIVAPRGRCCHAVHSRSIIGYSLYGFDHSNQETIDIFDRWGLKSISDYTRRRKWLRSSTYISIFHTDLYMTNEAEND